MAKTKSSKKTSAASKTDGNKITFFKVNRDAVGASRKAFHLLLSEEDHELLARLTHKMQRSAADVLRELIRNAAAE